MNCVETVEDYIKIIYNKINNCYLIICDSRKKWVQWEMRKKKLSLNNAMNNKLYI